jgi:hypothetical protein
MRLAGFKFNNFTSFAARTRSAIFVVVVVVVAVLIDG